MDDLALDAGNGGAGAQAQADDVAEDSDEVNQGEGISATGGRRHSSRARKPPKRYGTM